MTLSELPCDVGGEVRGRLQLLLLATSIPFHSIPLHPCTAIDDVVMPLPEAT